MLEESKAWRQGGKENDTPGGVNQGVINKIKGVNYAFYRSDGFGWRKTVSGLPRAPS
jgi:hypothetical protein